MKSHYFFITFLYPNLLNFNENITMQFSLFDD